jgi:acetyltransferase-like isoleucine patch superfamily enzyme
VRLSRENARRLTDKDFRNHAVRVARETWRGRRLGLTDVRVASGVHVVCEGTLEIAPGARIRQGCRIWVGPGATLSVGPGALLGVRGNINVAERLTIGAGTEMSWDCRIMDTDFHTIYGEDGEPRPTTTPVVIGERVLLGAGSTVLKGVTIGDGAVVAAASVVSRDVDPGAVVAGNPARPVGSVSRWE